ncbi:cache domain-containing protein [Streptomyces canus]|uniref:cache domain-containing protein n=1 Tax=Streptomyces canus TaxID=58343 RepID=UPI002782367F|nr:hypothetical protein [Streptomyces canus]
MARALSSDGDTVAEAVVRVSGMLESVFTTVQQTCEQTTTLLAHISVRGRRPTSADLAQLQPLLREQLAHDAKLISGTGFIAEPGLLSDVPAWLEWWQTRADGKVRPMLLDLDPDTSAFSDYTHWDWFALPRTTGQRAVSGPYVDYLCSDEYSLTLAAPVVMDGVFAGVAAADVYLRHFEAAVGPALRRIESPAFLVNPRGRVTASNTATQLAGSLVRDLDSAAARGEVVLHPCGAIPLVLVTAA